MAITYTAARALLASQATTLSAQATLVGLTSLATALTNLSTEITSSSISEDEFFGNGSTSFSGTGGTGGATPTGGSSSGSGTSKGSAAQVYAQILNSAAHTINCANFNIVFDNGSTPLGSILSDIAQASEDTARASETIASKLTAIETYQKKMKELGEGPGIHFIGPYEVFGLVSIYRMMIEQAKILESTGDAPTSEQVAQALIEVRRLSELIKTNISKEF